MRIVFLGIGSEQIGVELLSAVLKRAGHEVELVFNPSLFDDRFQLSVPALARLFDREAELISRAIALRPDVVAMSVLTSTYQAGLRMAAAIRAATGARVLFGGVHPSAVPEVVIAEDAVDAVCIGEGDEAFPALLERWAEGMGEAVPNVWFKAADGAVIRGPATGFIQDLDALPFPDKDLYADEFAVGDPYMTITGRGCPYRCTFCFNNFWAKLPARSGVKGGRYVRQRSVEHVIGELQAARRRWSLRFIDFEDDIFTVDKPWLKRFLDAYKREIKLPWMCLSHPKYVDQDIVDWMKEAGCTWVQIGIQSLDEQYKHRTMRRYEKVGDVAWALDAFRAAGIGVRGDHIFGGAGEPADAQEVARRFYVAHPPKRISTYWMTWLPGVEMTEKALADGLLSPEEHARLERGLSSTFHDQGAIHDPAELRRFANYEALFRVLPGLPGALRERARAEWFAPLPLPLLRSLSRAGDVALGFANRHPSHRQYAEHYARQMARHAMGRLQARAGAGPG
jgi:radical SAM superfamily enzyme YgiQ (UPF0313 family)